MALEMLGHCSRIAITTHRSPDGDAIGSSLGLGHFLRSMGKEVSVIVPDDYAENLKWLPGEVLVFERDPNRAEEIISRADLIFCMDYNDLSRIGVVSEYVKASSALRIMIDHHPNPSGEFDLSFSDTSVGSTAEMVFHFIDDLGEKTSIDGDMATCLLTGIITDTGSFKYGTTALTHSVASQLIRQGADSGPIQMNLFDQNTVDRLQLNGYAISKKLILLREHKTAIVWLTQEELSEYNYKKGDTEGLVNEALSISGIDVSILITPRDGETRLSFRSKEMTEVNIIARDHFNGGGHKRAAGGSSTLSVEETLEKVKEVIPQYV